MPRFAFLLVAAMSVAHGTAGAQGVTASDSARIHRQAIESTEWFIAAWRYYWQASEAIIHGSLEMFMPPAPVGMSLPSVSEAQKASTWGLWDGYPDGPRNRWSYLHCHPDSTREAIVPATAGAGRRPPRVLTLESYKRLSPFVITTGVGKRAICPTWSMFEGNPPIDEAADLDASIIAPLRPVIRQWRAELLEKLAAAVKQLPGDSVLTGQWVRFALDQRDLPQATRAANACTGPGWWCVALEGYARFVEGDPTAADELFLAAMTRAPPATRCVWNDVGVLLEHKARVAFDGMSCAEQGVMSARFWWLSDPLYLETGNARRAEHYARVMLFALRSGVRTAERWDMSRGGGGLGIREMILRYGWPSYSWWGGIMIDAGHFDYLGIGDIRYGRFTTAEFSRPRYHAVPAWTAILDPLRAVPDDWVLSAVRHKALNPDDENDWWPREHVRRAAGALVQIPEYQTAMFRRDSSALFAMAANLLPALFSAAAGDTAKGALFFSTGPESIRQLPRAGLVGSSAVFRAAIDSGPQLVGLELRAHETAGMTARTRFGITAPSSLLVMPPGAMAMSDLALIHPLASGTPLPNDPAITLSRMLGSVDLPQAGRLGVYWETYGVRASDTIDVSLRVERVATTGVLRRLGIALGVADRNDGGMTQKWREPSSDRAVAVIPARIPALGRALALDLSQAAPGDYAIVITIRRTTGASVTSRREFNIPRK
jgi:hypothetical protein